MSADVQRADRDGLGALEGLLAPALRADPLGVVSVWYGAVDGTPRTRRDEHVTHYAASTMKLPLLAAAHLRAERGELDLDTEVPVHNEFRSALDGSPFRLEQGDDQDDETWDRVGGTQTLRELARHAIVKSGNLATNLLLEQVGPGAVAEVLSRAGCSTDTILPRGIGDATARDAGLDNLVTAADLALVVAAIAGRRLAQPATCVAVEDVLLRQEHRDGIPAGLPSGTVVANKTGWVDGVTHDVALVRPPDREPYVLAVCTTLAVPEDTAHSLIAGLSEAIWREHCG
ncbi:MAG TPA: serine hydrolase [Nocardioidaceae bacterium]|nr:serine hydrolase [Nocardioidaceae bacterium]